MLLAFSCERLLALGVLCKALVIFSGNQKLVAIDRAIGPGAGFMRFVEPVGRGLTFSLSYDVPNP